MLAHTPVPAPECVHIPALRGGAQRCDPINVTHFAPPYFTDVVPHLQARPYRDPVRAPSPGAGVPRAVPRAVCWLVRFRVAARSSRIRPASVGVPQKSHPGALDKSASDVKMITGRRELPRIQCKLRGVQPPHVPFQQIPFSFNSECLQGVAPRLPHMCPGIPRGPESLYAAVAAQGTVGSPSCRVPLPPHA